MKELEKLNNYNLRRFLPPEKEPPYSLDRRLGGPQNRSERCAKETHLSPPGNPTPTVQPIARRHATETGMIRMECTLLYIYFSPDFSF
jgi:hypothetical protein